MSTTYRITGRFGPFTLDLTLSADTTSLSAVATKRDVQEATHVILNAVMPKVSELAGIISGIQTQVDKAKSEILTKIQLLEDELANLDEELPTEVTDAIAALKTSVQGVDDIVPDAPPADGGTGGSPAPAPDAAVPNAQRK